jgi:ATP-binding cassette subfamily C protein
MAERSLAQALRDADRLLWVGLALSLMLTLFVNTAVLVVPIYDMQLYDRVIQSHNLDTVMFLSLACFLGLVLYGLVDMLRSAALLAIADGIAERMSAPLLRHAIGLGLGGDAATSTQALRDIHLLRGFLGSGAVCVPLDAICGTLLLAVLFMLNPAYGFLGLGGASLLVLLNLLTDVLTRHELAAATLQRQRLAATLGERLRNPEVVDGLGMLPALGRRWVADHEAMLATLHHAHDKQHLLAGLAKIAKMLLQSGVMVVGAVMILGHATTPGSLMGANLLLNKLLGPFDALVGSWRQWALALSAWQRLHALRDGSGAALAGESDETAGLALTGVTLRVGEKGRALLSDINLHLQPGQMAAIIGPNGAGKSTLLRVFAGLLVPNSGTIRLDGVPLTATDRLRIGYLPQSVVLLEGSVAENISRFADAAAPVLAARQAGVHELIGRLPRGYDSELRPDAPAISGGQMQRIGLARALYGAPRLLVLDEPDASLDADGEAALRAALNSARAQGSMVVLTTHRPGLLAAMDLLVELQDGRIVATRAPAAPPAAAPAPRAMRMQPA